MSKIRGIRFEICRGQLAEMPNRKRPQWLIHPSSIGNVTSFLDLKNYAKLIKFNSENEFKFSIKFIKTCKTKMHNQNNLKNSTKTRTTTICYIISIWLANPQYLPQVFCLMDLNCIFIYSSQLHGIHQNQRTILVNLTKKITS